MGSPLHRSEWEPEENFNAETIAEWEKKKAVIKAKQIPPFDIKAFDKDQKRRKREKLLRQRARQEERRNRRQALQQSLTVHDMDQDSDPDGGRERLALIFNPFSLMEA
ncbi:hypothetical protein N7532_004682 [Penicillium argentinense]|uniref:Chromo domain-containing protein n=1 Tax=Penicillium argentinense TaxID=1131581 RepID=A0A9W9FPS8_9EURO|nr:uncharacterized protein N7532_004682 [Penicillium argentinense]KAJ5104153.1 hypothetical protein N7532_004682 [Penicillium argentinense]